MNAKTQLTIKRLEEQIQSRDHEGVTTVRTADLKVLLGHIKFLREDSLRLGCLISAGVDNWEGYDDAMALYKRSGYGS